MSILSPSDYLAAQRQRLKFFKSASRTSVAAMPESVFDLAGNPGAGTLNAGNTANGVVPTDAVAGYPPINAFGGGAVGYLSKVEFGSTVACWIELYDRIFACGAYAYNANTALSSQPSFASRVPGGNDFKGLSLWFEPVTAFTGNPVPTITYVNQDGTGSRTATIAPGYAPILGRCFQIPLQAGDSGVQLISNVACATATAGTFNINVLRPLWSGRVMLPNGGDVHDLFRTGMPQVFDNSAIYALITPDGTASGIPDVVFEIASK